jgi:cell division septum initiation protein DivIVA
LLRVPGAGIEHGSEVEELRARVASLERELAERTERANAAVAAAQERLYWVDRWKVDLDALMETRAARWAFRLTEQARRARRVAGRIRRRIGR